MLIRGSPSQMSNFNRDFDILTNELDLLVQIGGQLLEQATY